MFAYSSTYKRISVALCQNQVHDSCATFGEKLDILGSQLPAAYGSVLCKPRYL